VVFVATECGPWSKVGGLADVLAALPPALAARWVLRCRSLMSACSLHRPPVCLLAWWGPVLLMLEPWLPLMLLLSLLPLLPQGA
jgi:hypothetical protein